MRNNKRIAVTVAVVMGLVAVWAGWGAVHVGALAPDAPDRIAFGMVGITAGQTARLNVVYVPPDQGDKKGQPPDTPDKIVRLQFLDAMGRVVAEETVRLMPRHAAFLDLEFESRGIIIDNGREQIRGMIVDGGRDPNAKGTLLGTVEVFDNATGQTQFVLPGATVGIIINNG